MPTFVTREVEFDAGHRVPNHASKCRNPHGHRYRVVATITGQLVDRSGASDEGMVLDFGVISQLLKEYVHDVYDHGFIMYKRDEELRQMFFGYDQFGDFRVPRYQWKVVEVDWIPTAENMARAIFEDLYPEIAKMGVDGTVTTLKGGRVSLFEIAVFETPKSSAIYSVGQA